MKLRPAPTDSFPTPTSQSQAETEAVLLKHFPAEPWTEPPPALQKNAHMQFLVRNLVQGFPARYTSQDASQPWLMFWTLQAFSILQVGLDPGNKQRAIDKIMAWQHPDGGFGGGPGQAAHLLPTYASVCALAIAGRPGPGGGWDQIDRGIYCLLVTATLLDLLTPELVEGTAAFVASCQTYEGGFSSASQPYLSAGASPSLLSSPRPPLGEAHGGYTFCALASWVILQPFLATLPGPPPPKPKPTIDHKNLLRWLVQMQGAESELGGFRGRTNKLVDGCYSWWVGGSFALLEALGLSAALNGEEAEPNGQTDGQDAWDDVDDSFFNRKALQEYILYAGQHPAGGLRDKPPKHADAYHTLYCLSGLSAAQHHVLLSPSRRSDILGAWKPSPDSVLPDNVRKALFSEALCWTEEEGASKFVGGQANRVNATHPVFNMTMTHTEALMAHFYAQTVPPRVRKTGP